MDINEKSNAGRKQKHDNPTSIMVSCDKKLRIRFDLFCSNNKMSRGDALEFLMNLVTDKIESHVREWIGEQWIYFCNQEDKFVMFKPFKGSEVCPDMHTCRFCGERVVGKNGAGKDEPFTYVDGMLPGAGD